MKKSILYSLVGLLAISSVLTSCKKGEDDPAISLKTRKSRVAGEWKMTSGTSQDVYTGSNSTTTTDVTYDGTNANETQTITTSLGTGSTTDSYTYTYEVIFEKDGSFKVTEIEDGITVTAEGTWSFTGGLDDKKNKSQMVMNYSKVVEDGQTYTYAGGLVYEIYYLKELRSDKMVMTTSGTATNPDGTSNSVTSERILEPK